MLLAMVAPLGNNVNVAEEPVAEVEQVVLHEESQVLVSKKSKRSDFSNSREINQKDVQASSQTTFVFRKYILFHSLIFYC